MALIPLGLRNHRKLFGLLPLYVRSISVGQRDDAKLGVFLHKLIEKSRRRTPQQYVYMPHNSVVASAPRKVQERTRRQKVLNTIFMENISNIMATGEIGNSLKGLAVELTEVRISPDCTYLNVYWSTSLDEPGIEQKISDCLRACTGPLKTELINCQFMGRPPKITFVRDLSHGRAAATERLIEQVARDLPADLEDPSNESSDGELSKSDDMVEEGKGTESSSTPSQSAAAPVPPEGMKTNVYGLDRAMLMRQVLLKMKRAKGGHRTPADDPVSEGHLLEEGVSSDSDRLSEASTAGIAEFVHQRRLKKQLAARAEREAPLQAFQGEEEQTSDTAEFLLHETEDQFDEEEITKVSYLRDDANGRT
ncbi:unnamed protein product [Ixodes persulcatus]